MARILLLDDSSTMHRVVRLTFADDQRLEIAVARNRNEADQSLSSRSTDLIIAYVRFDGLSDPRYFESMRYVTPRILLLAESEENLESFIRSGFSRVLRKPFHSDELRQVVEEMLAQDLSELVAAHPLPSPEDSSNFNPDLNTLGDHTVDEFLSSGEMPIADQQQTFRTEDDTVRQGGNSTQEGINEPVVTMDLSFLQMSVEQQPKVAVQPPSMSAVPALAQRPPTSAAPAPAQRPPTSAAPAPAQRPPTSAAPAPAQRPPTSAAPAPAQRPPTHPNASLRAVPPAPPDRPSPPTPPARPTPPAPPARPTPPAPPARPPLSVPQAPISYQPESDADSENSVQFPPDERTQSQTVLGQDVRNSGASVGGPAGLRRAPTPPPAPAQRRNDFEQSPPRGIDPAPWSGEPFDIEDVMVSTKYAQAGTSGRSGGDLGKGAAHQQNQGAGETGGLTRQDVEKIVEESLVGAVNRAVRQALTELIPDMRQTLVIEVSQRAVDQLSDELLVIKKTLREQMITEIRDVSSQWLRKETPSIAKDVIREEIRRVIEQI